MNRWIILFSLLITIVLDSHSQEQTWEYAVGLGISYRFPNDFGPQMNGLLRDASSYSQNATNISLAADYFFTEKLTLGGELWTALFPSVDSRVANVSLKGIGVGAKASFQLIQADKWTVSPFIGLGFYHTKSKIENYGYLVNYPPLYVPPGSLQSIFGQLGYYDLGVRLMTGDSMRHRWGLSGGFLGKLSGTDWKVSWGDTVNVLSPPALSLLYLRLTLSLKGSGR